MKSYRIIHEAAQAGITTATQERTDCAGSMVVIDSQLAHNPPPFIEGNFRFKADSTPPALPVKHDGVLLGVDSEFVEANPFQDNIALRGVTRRAFGTATQFAAGCVPAPKWFASTRALLVEVVKRLVLSAYRAEFCRHAVGVAKQIGRIALHLEPRFPDARAATLERRLPTFVLQT